MSTDPAADDAPTTAPHYRLSVGFDGDRDIIDTAHARIFSAQRALFDRVAVVEPTPAFLPAIEHGEIHGQAAGINVRIFADEVDAERWLYFGSADD